MPIRAVTQNNNSTVNSRLQYTWELGGNSMYSCLAPPVFSIVLLRSVPPCLMLPVMPLYKAKPPMSDE